ncbi:MAG TPA: VOC family protein [Candidatus Dormibacteraeota bacterium]|nr:VOC family protein [Candidatus Dormibacteraeota bacterium]
MIRPCIVYVDRAEEAIKFYVALFPNSKILSMQLSEDDGPVAKGKVLGATFQLDGREYMAFDGGPTFNFTEGFSLMVTCKTQEEVDRYWSKLIEGGGEEGPCGWLKDRFGLSWQIVPEALTRMLTDQKSGDSQAAFQAMLKMKKIDIATLENAYHRAGVA